MSSGNRRPSKDMRKAHRDRLVQQARSNLEAQMQVEETAHDLAGQRRGRVDVGDGSPPPVKQVRNDEAEKAEAPQEAAEQDLDKVSKGIDRTSNSSLSTRPLDPVVVLDETARACAQNCRLARQISKTNFIVFQLFSLSNLMASPGHCLSQQCKEFAPFSRLCSDTSSEFLCTASEYRLDLHRFVDDPRYVSNPRFDTCLGISKSVCDSYEPQIQSHADVLTEKWASRMPWDSRHLNTLVTQTNNGNHVALEIYQSLPIFMHQLPFHQGLHKILHIIKRNRKPLDRVTKPRYRRFETENYVDPLLREYLGILDLLHITAANFSGQPDNYWILLQVII